MIVEQTVHDEGGDRTLETGERAAVQRLRLARTAGLFRAGGRGGCLPGCQSRTEARLTASGRAHSGTG